MTEQMNVAFEILKKKQTNTIGRRHFARGFGLLIEWIWDAWNDAEFLE